MPADFQRAERLLERGLIDAVVHRSALREWLAEALDALLPTGRGRRVAPRADR